MSDIPAFPSNEINNYGDLNQQFQGMTLRDYFAAKAMQAYATQEAIHCRAGQMVDDAIAENAYQVADAMMKARGNV